MTYIRRLELRGFKSSGPRTIVVNFEKGFTVITGPNGSGKSNIADAITFAIGENSPRQLRAANGRLNGLIYDPRKEDTPDAAKPSSCRVTIQFDNTDRAIPVDSDVVTVARELKSDGENLYFINGRKTTRGGLMEILDLAGLSPGGLNIVPQGSATRVADLTPEEKRRMIEDVVGIAKFDERRAEAQRQLGQADQRLEVALARIGEMKSTLESLDSQRNDKVRFELLEAQINWLTAVRTSKRIGELRERLSSLRAQERDLGAKLDDLAARQGDYDSRASAVESEKTRFIVDVIQGGGSSHLELQLVLGNLRNELATLEGDLRSAEANVRELEAETVPQLKQTVASKQKEVNASASVVRQYTSELQKLDARHDDMAGRLKEFFKAGEELRATIDKKGKQVAKVQVKLAELGQKLNSAELAINANGASLGAERKRLDELKLRVDGYSGVLGGLEKNVKELYELYEGSSKEVGTMDADIAGGDKVRQKLLVSIEGASKILERATAEVSKEEAFRQMSSSLAGERSGLLKLQELCESGGVPGYVGRVGQLLKYSPTHSSAVNAVIGKWMSGFVVEDLRSMTQLIRAAKSLKAKAFSVIPLSEVESSQAVRVGRSAGIVGPLTGVIKCDETYSGLVNFLAGDAALVETEAIGYILASEGVRAVTLEGEIFEPGGRAFTYGYQEFIMNLMEGLENLEGMSDIEDAVGALKGAIQRRRSELEGMEANSRDLMKERVKQIVSATSLKAEAATVTRIANNYRSIYRKLNAEYQKQSASVERLEAKLKSNTERRDSISKGISSLQRLVSDVQGLGLDAILAEIDATKQSLSTEIDSLRNRIAELDLNLSRERASLDNILTRALEDNEIDLSNALEDLHAFKELIKEAPRRIRDLTEQKSTQELQIQKLLDSSKKSQPVLDEFDVKIRRLREERDSVARSAAGTQKELFGLSSQISSVMERMEEAQGSLRMLGFAEEPEVFEASDDLLGELQQEYEQVAHTVNRGADKQYLEMYTNYKSLSVRNNELEKERNAIIRFMESVEGEKKKVFLAAFEKVSEEFSAIFDHLTGGEAVLELEKPDEVFTGGVSLIADFGSRRAESLELSGGQRAVTGVSLILAMQAVQTHPFYLFDEIDAALDAVNSGSLARFFKSRSSTAQIIAITLRDVFIAESSITYGVYAAGGVSRVVHYKPAEAPITRG